MAALLGLEVLKCSTKKKKTNKKKTHTHTHTHPNPQLFNNHDGQGRGLKTSHQITYQWCLKVTLLSGRWMCNLTGRYIQHVPILKLIIRPGSIHRTKITLRGSGVYVIYWKEWRPGSNRLWNRPYCQYGPVRGSKSSGV